MFPSVRRFGSVRALLLPLLTLSLASSVTATQAQTAPQLLPYTVKVAAGGGSTPLTVGATCAHAGSTPSGFTSTDKYADNCLATEVPTSELYAGQYGPHAVTTDANGVVYIGDDNNYLVRRIDPTTGVITLIAGGGTNAKSAAACTAVDSAHTVVTGDVFADGCLGTEVSLGSVAGLAFSPAGDLYIADTYNYNVRKMSFSNGGVAGVVITNSGSYASVPTVTFSAPPSGGVTATGTAVLTSGVVTAVTITNPGSGYSASAMPTVTFSASGSGTAATGTAVYTGVMSMAAGDYNGGLRGYGYSSGCDTSLPPATTFGSTCLLDGPNGITFDKAGNLYIADHYVNAVMVLNTNPTGSTSILNNTLTIPALTMVKAVGASTTTGSTCLNGPSATKGIGCNYTTAGFTNGTAAGSSYLDSPYGVAIDSSSDLFIANEFNNDVAEVSSSTAALNSYAGAYPESNTGVAQKAGARGPAGSFSIGSDFSIALDKQNNVYIPDALAGYVWRVDASSNSMYQVGGGGAATVAGSPCAASGIGANLTATDIYGDGCPGSLSSFSKSGTTYATTGVWGLASDLNNNVYVSDEGNGLFREIATGAQFGNTGASATDYIDVHFAAGDTPITASAKGAPFSVTPITLFSLGAPTCTTNSDTTTDCVVPVTASPSAAGPYTGTLTVVSNKVTGLTNFPLSGNFAQNPNTRLSLSFSDTALSCGTSGTTFLNTDTIAITGTLILAGPVPTGTITFMATPVGGGTPVQIGAPAAVVNMGTASAPVYGATVMSTFKATGAYTITANYNSGGGYYNPSTATGLLNSATPTFQLTPAAVNTQTVTAGQTALFSFLTTPTVYTGTITYAVTGLPANTSYTLTSTSTAVTGCSSSTTVALSVQTNAVTPTTSAAGMGVSGRRPWMLLSAAMAFGLALLIGVKLRGSRLGQMMMALLLLIGTSGLMACNSVTTANVPQATPTNSAANPYKITVTGTGSAGGSSSTTFNLIVQ